MFRRTKFKIQPSDAFYKCNTTMCQTVDTVSEMPQSTPSRLFHALTGLPVEKHFTMGHHCELFTDKLPYLLDGSGVTNESI
eukprot:gene634-1226_t